MRGTSSTNYRRTRPKNSLWVLLSLASFLPCALSFGILLGSFPNSSLWRERYTDGAGRRPPDHYDVLNIKTNASKDDIKTAFRRLAKAYHPDANPTRDTTAQFQRIHRAYETLSDPTKRQRYDQQLYQKGCSEDTPNFTIGGEDFGQPVRSTSETATERYVPLEPNENFNGSLFGTDKNDQETNQMFRIRTL